MRACLRSIEGELSMTQRMSTLEVCVCGVGQSAALPQVLVQTLPLSFFTHRWLLHAAGPKAQAEPTPPPPSGKQTFTSPPWVPSAFCSLPLWQPNPVAQEPATEGSQA